MKGVECLSKVITSLKINNVMVTVLEFAAMLAVILVPLIPSAKRRAH
jgi:hypothetical protein